MQSNQQKMSKSLQSRLHMWKSVPKETPSSEAPPTLLLSTSCTEFSYMLKLKNGPAQMTMILASILFASWASPSSNVRGG